MQASSGNKPDGGIKNLQQEEKKVKHKKLIMAIFVVFNIAVIAYTAYTEYHSGSSAEAFWKIHVSWLFLLPAIGCCIGAILLESLKYALVMKQVGVRMDMPLAAKTVLIGRYYDNITPSGIGGQPMQIYYLNKNGVPGAESAAITVAGFVTMQLGFVILALFSVLFLGRYVEVNVVRTLAYFGIIMYSVSPTMIMLFTYRPGFAMKLTRGIVSFLAKLHIVRNKEKAASRYVETVQKYSDCVKVLVEQKKMCAITLFLGILYQCAICSIPYFVIQAFGGGIGFLSTFATTVVIYAAITFIPTPGNSGVAEGVFYAVFSMLTSGYIFWAMLVWRFLVYYIFILVGIVIHVFEFIGKKKHAHHTQNEEK